MLALVGVRPFRCQICRNRFYHFSLQNRQGYIKPVRQRKGRSRAKKPQLPLKPSDEEQFIELITKIRRDERKIFGSANRENEPQ